MARSSNKTSKDLPDLLETIDEWADKSQGVKPKVRFNIGGYPFVIVKKYKDGSIKLSPETI